MLALGLLYSVFIILLQMQTFACYHLEHQLQRIRELTREMKLSERHDDYSGAICICFSVIQLFMELAIFSFPLIKGNYRFLNKFYSRSIFSLPYVFIVFAHDTLKTGMLNCRRAEGYSEEL